MDQKSVDVVRLRQGLSVVNPNWILHLQIAVSNFVVYRTLERDINSLSVNYCGLYFEIILLGRQRYEGLLQWTVEYRFVLLVCRAVH